jgi:uncharacterized protein YdhG (YjbR/CyaY superfamily)
MNREVDGYIEKQKPLQKEICLQLRRIVFETFPEIEESMKWGVPTYAKGKYYFVALKDHVNLGFSLKGLSKQEQKRLEGSGKTMKHVKIRSMRDIDKEEIVELLVLVWKAQEAKTQ